MYSVCSYTSSIKYEWDNKKRLINIEKHKIDFIDAILVLEDECALTIEVNGDKYNEKRYVTVGKDPEDKMLTIVYTHRKDVIRIISARSASRNERKQYEDKI